MIAKTFVAVLSLFIVSLTIVRAGNWEDALNAVKNDQYNPDNDEVPIRMKASVWRKIHEWSRMWPEFGQAAVELKRRIEAVPESSGDIKSILKQIFRDAERALETVI